MRTPNVSLMFCVKKNKSVTKMFYQGRIFCISGMEKKSHFYYFNIINNSRF